MCCFVFLITQNKIKSFFKQYTYVACGYSNLNNVSFIAYFICRLWKRNKLSIQLLLLQIEVQLSLSQFGGLKEYGPGCK